MAPKPVVPANGKPDSPPRLKLLPYIFTKSSSNTRANSSAQRDVARRVLPCVKPLLDNVEVTLFTSEVLDMAP